MLNRDLGRNSFVVEIGHTDTAAKILQRTVGSQELHEIYKIFFYYIYKLHPVPSNVYIL